MVVAVPAFQDNYIWIIPAAEASAAVVVDPGQAEPVRAWLSQHGYDLAAVLITHHHADHTGGVADLLAYADAQNRSHLPLVFGPSRIRTPEITHEVHDGQTIPLDALGLAFRVMAVPGHTLDHVAYATDSNVCGDQAPALFCGDTLFAGGCGRLFEGSAQQMWESLQKIAAMPAQTHIFCAHEYTLSNLIFAHHAMPQHAGIAARLAQVRHQRAEHQPTVPSRLGNELQTNPFLLCADAAAFAAMRQRKDAFRG